MQHSSDTSFIQDLSPLATALAESIHEEDQAAADLADAVMRGDHEDAKRLATLYKSLREFSMPCKDLACSLAK